jgi:phosphate transport system ATP-binding protein
MEERRVQPERRTVYRGTPDRRIDNLMELAAKPHHGARPSRDSDRLRFHVEGLNTWYSGKQALEDISIDIYDRKITALIGPSGCGKSTFLRCLNRMNDLVPGFKSTGTIVLDGHDIRARDVDVASLRAAVGMVFQHPNPFPMSIYENIATGVRQHTPKIKKAELDDVVEQSLRQANLWEEMSGDLKRSAFSISGGQQQRLCIARALAIKPEFIMLDEPCASLDPVSTARIETLLEQLSVDYPIVIVTHNLAQARRISDSMAFFLMGKLLESGDSKAMFMNPSRSETREYLDGVYG